MIARRLPANWIDVSFTPLERYMVRLSQHFTLNEATKSHVAIRKGIDNHAPAAHIPSLATIAKDILEPVRTHYGVPFSPSSWYRCPALNSVLGSKPSSQLHEFM